MLTRPEGSRPRLSSRCGRRATPQFVATGLFTGGEAVDSAGQWTLTGRWAYVSGVEFADWVLVSAPVAGGDETRFFALRRGQIEVLSTWDSSGMRATGSDTVVVDGARVPAHLSFARSDMLSGRNAVSRAACHNVPFQAVGGLTFAAPLAAAAAGALAAAGKQLAGRRRTAAAEVELVRSSGRVDVARMVGMSSHVALRYETATLRTCLPLLLSPEPGGA